LKRVRVIPVLLLCNNALYKTRKFKSPVYIGDPINTVKIFSEKEVDEIVLLDVNAHKNLSEPNYSLLEQISSECFIPITYGGGIRNLDHIKNLLFLGVEKVSINSTLFSHGDLWKEAIYKFGAQSIVASIDIKKHFWGYSVYTHGGTKSIWKSITLILDYVKTIGCGEIFLNSIDRDGTFSGYDLNLVRLVTELAEMPVTVCGGCSSLENMQVAISEGASAVASGSLFCFKGSRQSVLINYPSQEDLNQNIFSNF